MNNYDITEMVIGVIGFMAGFVVGCLTMLHNCQKYPDRYQIRNDESEDDDAAEKP